MDAFLDYIGAHLGSEYAVITGAPVISLVTAIILGAILYFAMKAYYSHELTAKESIIAVLRARLETTAGITAIQPETKPDTRSALVRGTAVTLPKSLIKLSPNIVCARTESRMIDDPFDDRNKEQCAALIVCFHNLPLINRSIGNATDVTASITYKSLLDDHEFTIIKGLWNTGFRHDSAVGFDNNSAQELILALAPDIDVGWITIEDSGDSNSSRRRTHYFEDEHQVWKAKVRLIIDGVTYKLEHEFVLFLTDPANSTITEDIPNLLTF